MGQEWFESFRACRLGLGLLHIGSGYWCVGCQKNEEDCNLRYIMVVRISDASGEALVSAFNEEAERIIGCSANELDSIKSQEGEENSYQLKLKEATWVPHLFRVSISQHEYVHEKRQRITARSVAPVDFAAESRFLIEEISKMTAVH